MYLTTEFGYIPVKVVGVERFANGAIRSVKVRLPEGSMPGHASVMVSTETGEWKFLEWKMTPLCIDIDQPMSPQELEYSLHEKLKA